MSGAERDCWDRLLIAQLLHFPDEENKASSGNGLIRGRARSLGPQVLKVPFVTPSQLLNVSSNQGLGPTLAGLTTGDTAKPQSLYLWLFVAAAN